ncbi:MULTISPECIES: diaminopimelate decarboxylase [Nitrosomonas]|uniref:Diaminopimelate decarboxylase n=2 Tax=Nitrosomonas eutropha TaxID=916 RepID=A0ABX5M9C4_9PROT|nr:MULTISPECIES: diaminopimelate decarboxylase [Nitrosomonas]ABI58682.1 diaminopimelate decarboxylase [Nitrosomonas eutropha C91]MXS79577.1 diaminopimelate decarboxylase [Nitrosomonas sp. GH22]PXV80155.1 diaminopimelate decarboxylase [Nitrosomonas eutropha]SCX20858.1 diaminopimelate decarboxylase [Nitrosomonas eutropha]SDW20479.1 diaminopimelate decarboxylase [Nitrosomonas eutropha]
MSHFSSFNYRNHQLFAEEIPLTAIAAEFGTPCYVYSSAAIRTAYQSFDRAFGQRNHLICYAVKANSNLAVLNLLARLGSGFDIVSGGELQRVLKAGGDLQKTVFSGVGKTFEEIRIALAANIFCFNVESEMELIALNEIAGQMGKIAPVSLRVNPDVDANTHPYISTGMKENKFGIPAAEAERIYAIAQQLPYIRVSGLDCHIGSQLTEIAPFIEAAHKMLDLLARLQATGISIEHLDLGGGLGVRYDLEIPPTIEEYVKALCAATENYPQQLLIEPGRSMVGNAGLLLTRVHYLKHAPHRNFAIVDAAMNDMLRPALYQAYHSILPIAKRTGETKIYQIVGPVCETGDFLGHDRNLTLESNDLLAVMSAGAYGMSMSSNYNTRPRAVEVMVDGSSVHLIRARETIEDLYALEKIPT